MRFLRVTNMSAYAQQREFLLSDVKAKLKQPYTCLSVIQREILIKLPPRYIGNEKEFVKLVLNAKLGKYDDSLQCIPVSIRNTKRIGTTGTIYGENPNIFFKVLTEFVVFQPEVSSQLSAKVEKLSASHIGLLVHDWFNASVPRNAEARKAGDVKVGDEVLLEVVRSIINRRMLSLECKMVKILKKAAVSTNSGSGVHKAFDSDDELVEENESNKKRKRRFTGCSDSGIDPESMLDSSLSGEQLREPVRKKIKTKHSLLDESANTESWEAGANNPMKDVSTPTQTMGQTVEVNSSQSSNIADDTVLEDCVMLEKKQKKKKKKPKLNDSQISEGSDVVGSQSVKKAKKKMSKLNESQISEGSDAMDSQSVKKAKKKKPKLNDSQISEGSDVMGSQSVKKAKKKSKAAKSEMEMAVDTSVQDLDVSSVKSPKKKKKRKYSVPDLTD